MPKFRHNSPLPYAEDEARKAEERSALEDDSKRRKFSPGDLLRRICQHAPGESVPLRVGDDHLHGILKDSGLINLSNTETGTIATRTHLDVHDEAIKTLTFRMEEQILKIRLKLEAKKPTE